MACEGTYTADLTGGQTFDQSDYDSTNDGSKCFDDNNSSSWWVATPVDGEWIEVQFSSAKQIERISIYIDGDYIGAQCAQLVVKASNTGSFGGEETTIDTIDIVAWTTPAWNVFDFDNSSSFTYYRIYFNDPYSGAWLVISEIEMKACSAEPVELEGEFTDAAGIADAVDAFNCTDEINEAVGVADYVEGSRETEPGDISENITIGDSSDGFNWSAWFRANRDRSVIRYYCTLTGTADGLSDLTIPISSFQATKRTGESTYLSVSVPGVAQAEDIADRSNGELVIYMAYLLDGVESLREEILRVELEQINPQEGARSRSINLIGHKTVTYDARAVSVQGCNYKYTSGGSRGFRFPQADPYLNPGDALTVVDTEDVLTVDYITYAISAKGAKFMEVREG